MEQEKAERTKRSVFLNENDHDKIVGTVFKPEAHNEKKEMPQNDSETTPRKKRPRISRKVDY